MNSPQLLSAFEQQPTPEEFPKAPLCDLIDTTVKPVSINSVPPSPIDYCLKCTSGIFQGRYLLYKLVSVIKVEYLLF